MKISKIQLENMDNGTDIHKQAPKELLDDGEFLPFGYKKEVEELEYTRSEVNTKIEEAYQRGLQEGRQQGVQETTQNVLTVEQSAEHGVQKILQAFTNALNDFESQKIAYKRDMSKLAHHVIKKVIKDKISENAEDIIIQAFDKILPIVSKEPEIIIKMNGNMLARVQSKMEKIIAKNNFKGDISFIAENNLTEDMCKVEWSSNGINFDLKEKIKEIDEIINEYIKSI